MLPFCRYVRVIVVAAPLVSTMNSFDGAVHPPMDL